MSFKRTVPRGAGASKRQHVVVDSDGDDDDDEGLTMDCPADPEDVPSRPRLPTSGPNGSSASGAPGVGAVSETATTTTTTAFDVIPHGLDRVAIAASWARPPEELAKLVGDTSCPLSLQIVDVDFYTDVSDGTRATRAVVRVFGITRDGVSVLMHVPDFRPYFYVRVPPSIDGSDPHVRSTLLQELNATLTKAEHAWDYVPEPVLSIESEQRQSVRNYSFSRVDTFFKIELALPSSMGPCRQLLEDGLSLPLYGTAPQEGVAINHQYVFDTFESNCAFPLRFMVDHGIVGCGWVSATGDAWKVRDPTQYVSRCQLEVDVSHLHLVAHPTTSPEWMSIAPMRILSFDIECMGRPGIFPEAEHDPVIQIANYVQLQGQDVPIVAVIFTLGTCSPTGCGAQVLSYEHEVDLLNAWACFVRLSDPDLLTGYNIPDFDLPYLLDRAQALGVVDFPFLGRVMRTKTRAQDKVFQSKQTGQRKSKEVNVEGCVVFDAMKIFRTDERLASYSLNSVSSHFLGDQKEDVPHTAISGLQRGDADTRRRLAVYCLKDARLPLRLLDKRMKVVNYVEMARVVGVPLSYLLTRGQQVRVMSMLYRKCGPLGLVLPVARNSDRVEGDKYEGATVIEPVKGFYKDNPIATLDFASLYPSIMQAHNLCYSTLLRREDVARLPPEDVTTSPTGDCFVKATRQKGVLPMILEELLSARKQAKRDMGAAKGRSDNAAYAVYDGRQLALKVSANSVYGFTGAQVGQLPCLEIGGTVTAFGRKMIDDTWKYVEANYTVANGYEHDAKVIYGDTDSVMIKFGTTDLAESMRLGLQAAGLITSTFLPPIKLEFEKCYFPYLLMNKKRYAGLLWTNATSYDKLDAKGLETVRRDNCGLVRELVDTALRRMIIDRDVEGAQAFIRQRIRDLLCGKVDMSMLLITKALTRAIGAYADGGKQAHVELVSRMMKRDPGSAPKVGDRVPYVMITADKKAKNYEKSEDPIHVLTEGLTVDTSWYLTNQLEKPIGRLFEAVLSKAEIHELFAGDHTRHVVKSTPTTGGIVAFIPVSTRCLWCRTPLHASVGGSRALCASCTPHAAQAYATQASEVVLAERAFAERWTQCQRCQGSLRTDVLCQNRDCTQFYSRTKAHIDLRGARARLERFNDDATVDLSW